MLHEDPEELLATIRHGGPAESPGELDSVPLPDLVHHPDRGSVPEEDALGIDRHGITHLAFSSMRAGFEEAIVIYSFSTLVENIWLSKEPPSRGDP